MGAGRQQQRKLRASQLARHALDFANELGAQEAGFFVVGRLVEAIRLVDIAP
jgi:hypothetical protein